jgi:hypothetical protein
MLARDGPKSYRTHGLRRSNPGSIPGDPHGRRLDTAADFDVEPTGRANARRNDRRSPRLTNASDPLRRQYDTGQDGAGSYAIKAPEER